MATNARLRKENGAAIFEFNQERDKQEQGRKDSEQESAGDDIHEPLGYVWRFESQLRLPAADLDVGVQEASSGLGLGQLETLEETRRGLCSRSLVSNEPAERSEKGKFTDVLECGIKETEPVVESVDASFAPEVGAGANKSHEEYGHQYFHLLLLQSAVPIWKRVVRAE